MADWTFPFFETELEYPDDQKRIKLGQGYTLTVQPFGPIERKFILTMNGMQRFLDSAGDVDKTIQADRNMDALLEFYEAKRLHTEWTIDIPAFGTRTVRFNRPLKMPKMMVGGFGVFPEFEIELIEVP